MTTFQPPRHPFEIALEQRNNEIKLFWQRSNYFLVLNSALAVGLFSSSVDKYNTPITLFGIGVSVLWFLTNLGSKFWQEKWEIEVSKSEPIYSAYKTMFNTDSESIVGMVRCRFEEKEKSQHEAKGNNFWAKCFKLPIQKTIHDLICLKPSVSKIMMVLSLGFVCIWAYLFLDAIQLSCC